MASNKQALPPHVAILLTPGIGHLIPLVELANRLVAQHGFLVTFLVPNDGSPMKPQKQLLHSQPTTISSVFLPPVNFDDLPEHVQMETRIAVSLTRSLVPLREAFESLTESSRVVALVVDIFGPEAFEVAKDLGVLPYLFFPTTAMLLSFVLHFPKLDQTYTCEYRDLTEPVKLPGCFPVRGMDLPDPVQDRNGEAYKWSLHISPEYTLAAGIMVNSFMDLEPGAFKALIEENDKLGWPPVYPVGPLTRSGSDDGTITGCDCLRWLDGQPEGSVLFVSFGSGGTLSGDQLYELGMGLEMSGHRFLWVVRSPHDKVASATYFGSQSVDDPLQFLPKGFLDRTKEVAPQVQVLSHASTGGFLSHCGWNSALESLVNGVPLIVWPLYAEQRMNAVLLADDLKVAVRVKPNEKGLVAREDIANYVRAIFSGDEGKHIRNKMREYQLLAEKSLSQDGLSTKSLAVVASIWKNHQK